MFARGAVAPNASLLANATVEVLVSSTRTKQAHALESMRLVA